MLSEKQSIWVTLIEKLLANESPLVTTVNVIGALEAKPMSTYTKNRKQIMAMCIEQIINCWIIFSTNLNYYIPKEKLGAIYCYNSVANILSHLICT